MKEVTMALKTYLLKRVIINPKSAAQIFAC